MSKHSVLRVADYIFKFAIIFLSYVVTGLNGLSIGAVSGFATLVWFPSGISLAALLLGGYRFFPAVFLSAFFVNFLNGASLEVAFGIAVGNSLEALIGAYLLNKLRLNTRFSKISDVLKLVLVGAVFSTAISATIGVTTLFFGKVISSSSEYHRTWVTWWIGDMLSDLVVAPFILAWSKPKIKWVNISRFCEALLMAIVVLLASLLIFTRFFHYLSPYASLAYILYPILLWVALRFGPKEVTGAVMIISLISIWGTAHGFGPYGGGQNLSENLLLLQGFIGTVAATSLLLTAIIYEKNEHERRKDDFISIASHELKTPITTISSYLELLQKIGKKIKNDKVSLYVSKMDDQVKRLSSLVSNLLDVSKIQASKLILNKEKFYIDDLVADTIADLQKFHKFHKIILKETVHKRVFADKFRIAQVITNLITNAGKYSPKSNKIFIKIAPSDSKNVVVSVVDFGIGIDPKYKKYIFGRFSQIDIKMRPSFSGLGLGLYICNQIIKQHGGRIWVESQKGKGSTFSFELPVWVLDRKKHSKNG
ncbi:MAG TPA: MASE1 domain-containing protein [Candidatus Saccharimonadales bacterium]|nr:MASE1 domain-containing protein [Candidatus Saccharimonadales bacterium]